jgi:hypothetical protein
VVTDCPINYREKRSSRRSAAAGEQPELGRWQEPVLSGSSFYLRRNVTPKTPSIV